MWGVCASRQGHDAWLAPYSSRRRSKECVSFHGRPMRSSGSRRFRPAYRLAQPESAGSVTVPIQGKQAKAGTDASKPLIRGQILPKTGCSSVCLSRNRRTASPMAVMIRTPATIAAASLRVCIAPREIPWVKLEIAEGPLDSIICRDNSVTACVQPL